jgi:hypothetical protein
MTVTFAFAEVEPANVLRPNPAREVVHALFGLVALQQRGLGMGAGIRVDHEPTDDAGRKMRGSVRPSEIPKDHRVAFRTGHRGLTPVHGADSTAVPEGRSGLPEDAEVNGAEDGGRIGRQERRQEAIEPKHRRDPEVEHRAKRDSGQQQRAAHDEHHGQGQF